MFEQVINLIISPELQKALFPVKMIFFAVDLLLIAFLIFALLKTRWFKLLFWYRFFEFFTMNVYGGVLAKMKLGALKSGMGRRNSNKVILKIHKALDKVLSGLAPMHQANTFSERLARVGSQTFSDLPTLWEMHEVWRKIKREPDYKVDEGTLIKSIKAYEQAIIDLES